MQTLSVVNMMLAKAGETALAALTDNHEMLDDCLAALDASNREVQSRRWWFNEETITLSPNAVDSYIYLPNDLLEIIPAVGTNYVMRGNRLYNKDGGTYIFSAPVKMTVYRYLDFEDLPETAAQYIAALSVFEFQTDFDGDSNKSQLLAQKVQLTLAVLQAQETRQRKVNLLDNNYRLARIKHYSRRYYVGNNPIIIG